MIPSPNHSSKLLSPFQFTRAGAGAKGQDKSSGADYSQLLSPLYAILMVLIGMLLPMTEALQDRWNTTIYNMVYNVYSLGMAILSVLFLQWLLLYQRRHHEHDDGSSILKPSVPSVDLDYDARSASPDVVLPSITVVPPSRSGSLNDIDDDDAETVKVESNSPVSPEMPADSAEPAAAVSDKRASLASNQSSDDDSPEILLPSSSPGRRRASEASVNVLQMINEQRRFSVTAAGAKTASAGGVTAKIRLGGAAESSADNQDVEQEAWIDLMKLGSVFSHEGSNLYLRLWQLGFTLGNVVYIILEIQFQMSSSTSECAGTYGWTFVFRLVFIITQTFFLFKNQTLEVKMCEVLVRFALMHLIATNTSVWLRTLVNEIMFEYHHYSHDDHHGTATNTTPDAKYVLTGDCKKFDELIEATSPYLFPFVLEYSLIAMGTLAVMYSAVDEATDEQANTLRRIQNLFRVPALSANYAAESGEHAPILQKSHRGFFTGVLVLSGGFVAIIMFYFATTEFGKALVYLVTLISLHGIMLLATGVALVKINQLSYIARPVSVDDILLLLSMSGEVIYELSIIMASSHYVVSHSGSHGANESSHDVVSTATHDDHHSSDSDSSDHFLAEILRLVASGIAVIQAILQVLLTVSGLRRYPLSQSHLDEMPGRGVITFLIVANVTVWICRTALVKAIALDTMIDYYTTLPWLLLANINLPLLLFYRFHSSFCLADIWHSAYTYPASSAEHGGSKGKAVTTDRHRSSTVFNNSAFDDNKVMPSNGAVKRYALGGD